MRTLFTFSDRFRAKLLHNYGNVRSIHKLQRMHVLFKLLHKLTSISNGKSKMYTIQMLCLHIHIQLKSMLKFNLLCRSIVLHILTFGRIEIQFKIKWKIALLIEDAHFIRIQSMSSCFLATSFALNRSDSMNSMK